MTKMKKIFSTVLVMLFTLFTVLSYTPAQAARKPTVVPQVQFANAPVTEYKVGDRVGFNIYSPNYGGRVEYRVVLWNDSKKSYSDLWNSNNGYPTRYYTKWQPYGNNIFTLGWIINDPGSYRITVYAKRVGIPNSKGALKGFNCDSFMESVAFRVKAKEAAVQSILPIADITVNQGVIPTLPSTVRAVMDDATEKTLKVTWGSVDITRAGTFTIQGTVDGTNLKATLRLIVNPIQTTLNVYSVEAASINAININLRESIGFTPALARFSLSGYGSSNLRLYTVNMSTDKKIIQLSTDTLTLGNWYTLKIDGTEYVFQVPYNIGSGSNGYKVTLTANDLTLPVNTSKYPDITVYPSNTTLNFTSDDSTIARYDSYTGKVVGVKPGITTFYVTGSKTGYTSASDSFRVQVTGNAASLEAAPSVLVEAVENDGSLVSGEIIVTSDYEYFRSDINTNNVKLYNLPEGLTYTVERIDSRTLKIYIEGNAENHGSSDDKKIYVRVLNGLYSGSDYLISNEVLINFTDKTMTSIDPIDNINKPLGTLKTDLGLPGKVIINLSNGTKPEVNVTWDKGTPVYNANLSGEYIFKGTVSLPSGVTNPDNLKAQVKVTLANGTTNVTAEDFGVMTSSGVMGYNVGFHLVDATASDVRNVVVNLYNGNTLLATNTSKNVLTSYGTATSLSAPFDVFGTFDYEEDGNWTYSGWEAANNVIPTQAVIIVTFKNGLIKTAVNNTLTGDTTIFTKGDVTPEDFSVMNLSGVLGYNVGFHLVDATAVDVRNVVVKLYKEGTLLATNTSKNILTNYSTSTSLSAPFDIRGTFDYVADGNWTYSEWGGAYTDIPTKAEIIVTFKNGLVKTAINTNLTGDTSIIINN